MTKPAFRIHIKRDQEIKAPFEILNLINNDWAHFSHLHRKTIANHRLVYKEGKREIFLYKARILYPFPLYDYYVVFRDYPTPQSYRNAYVNAKTGLIHYLHAEMVDRGETTSAISNYLFSVPSYWRLFPKLFFWIFRKRMQKITDEDNEWTYGLMTSKNPEGTPACAPVIPEAYDPLGDGDAFDEKLFASADAHFEYHVKELFDDKKRWPAAASYIAED